MTRGHGGVDGIERRCAHQLQSHVERQSVALHVVHQTLQVEQGGVTLVAVIQLCVDAELVEHYDTADTEQILLLDAVLPVAAIQLVGDGTVPFGVLVQVGVEQVELHAPHVHTPYVAVDDAAGEGNFQNHGLAVLVQYRVDGKLVEVLALVVGYLLAVHGQALREVAVLIEETYGGHVHARVRCLLDVVTGQYAQTSGVDLQTVAQSVLHREIAYRRNLLVDRLAHIVVELAVGIVDTLTQSLVVQYLVVTLIAELLQQHYGVLAHRAPQVVVQVAEQALTLAVPYPPQVFRHHLQGLQLCRDLRTDCHHAPVGSVRVAYFEFHIGF